MAKYQKGIIVTVLMLIFTTFFLHSVKSDFGLIFKKDLLAHDESSNSVVAANITRKFFPPMVRVNPLVEQQGNWMEGPYWQHIPPLFAYVPYLFFKLDGGVTIEVKRLAYAFVDLLTGLLFIFGVYQFRKSVWAAGAATIAVILWTMTPFSHELITGYAFGVSDIVLAFTIVASFCAILWYLEKDQPERTNYPIWKLGLIALTVTLPILAKNVLGGIPIATFFAILAWDHRKLNKQIAFSVGAATGLLLLYYLPLYFSSPTTFNNEILVSFSHFKQLEGWTRPWHWYITNYLPQRYLGHCTALYYLGLIGGLTYFGLRIKFLERKDKILLGLSGGWFLWNLVVISLVTSKVPNFIYQSFLFSLFFITNFIIEFARNAVTKQSNLWNRLPRLASEARRFENEVILGLLIVAILVTGYEVVRFEMQFKVQRAQAYDYQTEHEKFYGLAEVMKGLGIGTKDLIIVRLDDSDCWFRYYPLFVTGTESKTLLEMSFGFDPNAIKQKYNRMYFVVNKNDIAVKSLSNYQDIGDFSLVEFDLQQFSVNQIQNLVHGFIEAHQADIAQDIVRIKADKTNCQWLVPDAILNAP